MMSENYNEETEKTINPDSESPKPKMSKKKKRLIILMSVIGLLIVLAILAYSFRGYLLYKFKPKTYVCYSLGNTFEILTDDAQELKNGIFGFDIENDENYTIGFEMEDTDESYKLSTNIAFIANEKLSADWSYTQGKTKYDGLFNWNDENIELASEQLSDKYKICVKSKEFGKQFNNHKLKLIPDHITVDENTDISFSNIFKNEEIKDNDKEKTKDIIINFVTSGSITDNTHTKFKINGKSEKTKLIAIKYSPENVKKLIYDLHDVFGDSKGNKLAENIAILKEKADDGTLIKSDIIVDYYIFDDILTGIKITGKSGNYIECVTFNTKDMINSWSCKKVGNGINQSIYADGNIIPAKNLIDYHIKITDTASNSENNSEIHLNADFNKEKYEIKYSDSPDEKAEIYTGIISNKDKFKLGFELYELSCFVSLDQGAEFKKIENLREYMILEKSDLQIMFDFRHLFADQIPGLIF